MYNECIIKTFNITFIFTFLLNIFIKIKYYILFQRYQLTFHEWLINIWILFVHLENLHWTVLIITLVNAWYCLRLKMKQWSNWSRYLWKFHANISGSCCFYCALTGRETKMHNFCFSFLNWLNSEIWSRRNTYNGLSMYIPQKSPMPIVSHTKARSFQSSGVIDSSI